MHRKMPPKTLRTTMTKSDLVANVIATPIATWLGCGYSPVAPGTAGSAAALLMAVRLHTVLGWAPSLFPSLSAPRVRPRSSSACRVGRGVGPQHTPVIGVD